MATAIPFTFMHTPYGFETSRPRLLVFGGSDKTQFRFNRPSTVFGTARISEILRRGAERAEITVEQVLRELAKIGFSDIRKAVAWLT